ncbi:aminotransferase class V-fold PLP-dependent enzyme [Pimelobacter simplex]|uniref:Cysteine desulfurase n=3 Tax=Nocardioides simplex TaxID=2045 RepID=A0A0A1DPH7_NOCSI|nr:aminotransferase class V-fold PLP-dependent enzyme [Pimelobacter simplex]AIY17300.1 Cysteine desulfurase [Pimelobacter simplex]GEB13339.1 putative aminotransferase/cysteine desulfurase [Pimelobacter simplex]SFM46181.1 Selenocysteine lyase/Cysteine desulfurase [Pimelobacter simplex]
MTLVDQTAEAVRPLLPVTGADLRVPLVTGGSAPYANLDIAASAPALRSVSERVDQLLPYYSSVHRGAGHGSAVSTAALDAARRTVAGFVGARPDDVVQVVRHTTDAFNLLASAVPGDVVTLDVEHHANLLPWARGRRRTVAAGRTLAATVAAVEAELAREPAALLAVTGASNVTGEVLPLADLVAVAHRHGARIAVDGAQLVPHRRVDVAGLGIDYLAFSGHKLYAPYGAGVLVGRPDWLEAAPPYLAGGGAVRAVALDAVEWAPVPARHEAGTPNVVGAVALAAACETLAALPPGEQARHESALGERLRTGLAALPGLRVLRLWDDATDTLGLATFTLADHPAELVAQYLSAEHGIAVRAGRFCAHPLLARLNDGGTAVRASVGLGTSSADVDRLLAALDALVTTGPRWTYDAAHLPAPDPRPLPHWIGRPG